MIDSLTPLFKKRVFVAVEIPVLSCPQAKGLLSKLKKETQAQEMDVKWVPPANWHITLWFFGETEVEKLQAISQGIRSVAEKTSPFELDLKGLGCFPEELAARVLWVGSSTTKELLSLHQEIGVSLGLNESVDYRAHMTLGRLRSPQSVRRLLEPFRRKRFDSVKVTDLVLYESQMQGYGSQYHQLERFPLTNRPSI